MAVLVNLKNLGLTEYESKIYIALIQNGELKAKELSEKSEVPYSKTYEVTSLLEKKGLIEIHRGRPMLYRTLTPSIALSSYADTYIEEIKAKYVKKKMNVDYEHESSLLKTKNSLESASDMLQSIYDEVGNVSVSDDFIWTFRGKENIVSQVHEMVASAKHVKMLVHEELGKYLCEEIYSMSIDADLILQSSDVELNKIPENVHTYVLDDMGFEFGVIIADGETALFTTGEMDTAFKSSNNGLVTILTQFFKHEKEEATLIQ